MWISTGDFKHLVEAHYPASTDDIRAWCEEGIIPDRYAKKRIGLGRTRWMIAVSGIGFILKEVLQLQSSEICEVQSKSGFNFNTLGLVV